MPRGRIAAIGAAALVIGACSSGGKKTADTAPSKAKTTTVVTAGADLPTGSDSCDAPTVITSNGTSSGATGGYSDKHGTNGASPVPGGGAPDAVWRIVLAKDARVTVRSNGMGHFVGQLVIAYAPDFKGAPFIGTAAPACGSPGADKAMADNLTQSTQHNDFTMTLTADLKAGPYLVWLDGDGAKDVKGGNYQVSFQLG